MLCEYLPLLDNKGYWSNILFISDLSWSNDLVFSPDPCLVLSAFHAVILKHQKLNWNSAMEDIQYDLSMHHSEG